MRNDCVGPDLTCSTEDAGPHNPARFASRRALVVANETVFQLDGANPESKGSSSEVKFDVCISEVGPSAWDTVLCSLDFDIRSGV